MRQTDVALLEALTRAYAARAKLFHRGVMGSKVDLLIAEIDSIDDSQLQWELRRFGITQSAFRRLELAGGRAHQVFLHPSVLQERPHLIAYYRNIATISQKGISQILFPTHSYETRQSTQLPRKDALALSRALNSVICHVIDTVPDYDVSVSRKAILAEIGTQLQGTWVNVVGQGASRAVEEIIRAHVEGSMLGGTAGRRKYRLHNGWSIVFGSEPDVAFFDAKGVKQIAVEIKGSLDVAGAQTRYGEAKKSFAKQVAENPRCHTVYLASCFTDAVIRQIRADGQVREWFNLTSILYDDRERTRFVDRLFHIVSAPPG